MDHIELLNVEYGDCTVFVGDQGHCLMVDCGSSNNRLRKPAAELSDVFSFIQRRYAECREIDFLLTHYHRDHMRGFKKIIADCPTYFKRIYIPYLPRCVRENGNTVSPLLDFAAVSAAVMPYQSENRRVNISCLNIFGLLKNSVDRVYTLSADDHFYFDRVRYEVLSPKKNDFHYNPRFIQLVGSLEALCGDDFLNVKKRFLEAYYQCLHAFSVTDRASDPYLYALAERLGAAYEALIGTPSCESSSLNQILEITSGMEAAELYSEAMNSVSVVFHNVRSSVSNWDILMTGDAPQAVLPDFENRLYGDYNIVKAPHHGSGYWDIFSQMGINHMLISSGDYPAGGELCQSYVLGEYVCHCTNRCGFSADGCCNKLKFCYDFGALALKCKLIDRKAKPCKIYIVTPSGFSGCSQA